MFVLIVMYFVLFGLNIIISGKNRKYLYVFTILILAFSSVFVIPTSDMDLYRHYITLDNFRTYGVEYFSIFRYTNSLPLYAIYFYIISLFDSNGVLPFVPFIVTYGSIMLMLYYAEKDFNLSDISIKIAYFLMIFLNSYIDMLCIRNLMIFAVDALILYIDLVKKKNKLICFVGYCILTTMHYSGLFIIILRIIYEFFSKSKVFWPILIIICAWTIFQNTIYGILINYDHIAFVHLINSMFKLYLAEEEIRNPVFSIVRLLMMIVFFIIGIYCNKNLKCLLNEKEIDFIKFSNAFCLFTLGTCSTDYLFLRLVMFACIVCPLIVAKFISIKGIETKVRKIKLQNIIIICIVLLNVAAIFYYHYRFIYFW